MRLNGKGTAREGERGLQIGEGMQGISHMAQDGSIFCICQSDAYVRITPALKRNGAKTGGAWSPAKEEGGRGVTRMQNRLSARAVFDAYLKKASFWGVGDRREATFGPKTRLPPESDNGKGVSSGLSRVQHR